MIKSVFRHIKILVLVFLIFGVSTYLFCSYFLSPMYQSVAVLYPPNTHSFSHLVSAGMRFGYDKEIGEHVEILESNPVKNSLIQQYDLGEHYKIDKESPYFNDLLLETYNDNISISRSINKSIQITVLDEDPRLSAEMANSLISLADQHKSDIIHSNLKQATNSAKISYENKHTSVRLMSDSLNALRNMGEVVWNLGEERKSGRYSNYEMQYRNELDQLYSFKTKYEELESLLNQEVPKSYIISSAISSSKAVFPRKGLSALLMGGIAALAVFIGLQIKEE